MRVDEDGVIQDELPAVRKVFLRTPYNYDGDAVSRETGLSNTEPSMAQQHFKEEVDINTIVARFGLTGQMPEDFRAPEYGDFSDVVDFQSAQNAVLAAQAAFMEMPAGLRARFDNNPQTLMEFLADRANLDEARTLGLVAPASAPAAVVPPTGAPAAQGGTGST